MKSAVLLINKEKGISSARVVAKLKAKFGFRKIGHAGTLDPDAEGLLVCVANGATRLASYAQKGEKVYSGVIRLGLRTDTDDTTGEVLEETNDIPGFGDIADAARQFTGEVLQVPPQYSAIKVNGKKAYDLARKGASLTLAARNVFVSSFSVAPCDERRIAYTIHCSSGTYIRSLARDMGDYLGCGACTEKIVRERSAPFDLADAKTVEEITESDFKHWSVLVKHLPMIELDKTVTSLLQSGDQRAFHAPVFKGLRDEVSDNVVLYRDQESREAGGLLRVKEGRWSIELNVGE